MPRVVFCAPYSTPPPVTSATCWVFRNSLNVFVIHKRKLPRVNKAKRLKFRNTFRGKPELFGVAITLRFKVHFFVLSFSCLELIQKQQH